MQPIIRIARPEDAGVVTKIYAPYCLETAISFETEAPSEREMAGRITNTLEVLPWLVLEDENDIRGYAYSSSHRERAAYRWSVDASAYVHPHVHRKGVGRALYTSLFEILRLQGFYRVHAGITLPNEASVGLHRAMGFEPIGIYRSVGYKMGRWHDVGWYQLCLNEGEEPAEPVPFSKFRETPEAHGALVKGLDSYRSV